MLENYKKLQKLFCLNSRLAISLIIIMTDQWCIYVQLLVVISVDIVHLVLDLVLENTRKLLEKYQKIKKCKIILENCRKCQKIVENYKKCQKIVENVRKQFNNQFNYYQE